VVARREQSLLCAIDLSTVQRDPVLVYRPTGVCCRMKLLGDRVDNDLTTYLNDASDIDCIQRVSLPMSLFHIYKLNLVLSFQDDVDTAPVYILSIYTQPRCCVLMNSTKY